MSKTIAKLERRLASPTPKHIYPVKEFTVRDGDTIKTVLDLGFYAQTTGSCRVAGVDTPELKTEAGRLVKGAVESWFAEMAMRDLRCVSLGRDKFGGRFVGTFVEVGQAQTLSHWLLSHGLARPYDGGRKQPWTDSELAEICRRAEPLIVVPELKVFRPGDPEMN